jgi:YXWGXW repeat-containing protein
MKKALLIIGIAGCLGFAGCEVGYVSEQPADAVYERPIAPGDGYIWIDGDWVWGGGGYHWHGGHWERPRAGRAWERGHWDHTNRGYHWNHGHWR